MGSNPFQFQEHDDDAPFGAGRTVAVIGGGFSGVCTTAHLLKRGLVVTLFERSSVLGGVWHYDDRVCVDPLYPNNKPSLGDYRVSAAGEHHSGISTPPEENSKVDYDEETLPVSTSNDNKHTFTTPLDPEVEFSPPGPCYAGLKTNVPTHLMVSSLVPWPEGTERSVGQQQVEEYIHRLAKDHGVDEVALLHTRVDEVRKSRAGKWEIRTVSLQKNTGALVEKLWHFDLVVVASGHYNMPRIPDIPGLRQWKAAFPGRVIHSKQYRSPAKFKGENILVIGGGVSAVDICRELGGVAANTYQSVRGGAFDLPLSMLPTTATRVAEVVEFTLDDRRTEPPSSHQELKPIPGRATLGDGTVLDNIHHVVMATGYITSYPFLPQLHCDSAPIESPGDELLVTSDGVMAHNLHKDMFYIKDPTLAFVGVPYHVATFSLFDFQAQAISWVFSGQTHLPTEEEMRGEYRAKVKVKGHGREFHSLHAPPGEIGYVSALVEWVNRGIGEKGAQRMRPHSEEWVKEHEKLKAMFAGQWKKS
ncbi:hypothetical protein QBC37DRAFT_415088 [Rhypophila decipiens]|uniref:Flavin-containing monooxygenase n=1 Tax=Rhypophila decipiens TaxID=261697 RepID=A0AAN6YF29_9PEZI|nr:hypothetical protein QBC37DRAFT_415088 [Rhypophila decipiens]